MPKKGIYILFLMSLVVISCLELYSTEWARLKIMEYYLDKKNYDLAEEIGMKIVRKRSITGSLDRKFMETIGVKWDNAMTLLIEKEVSVAENEWRNSRTFFKVDRNITAVNQQIASKFDRIRIFVDPNFSPSLNAWKRYHKLISSVKPYAFETGFIENDVNPGSGQLSFGCGGGVALDYNLRSIGANLGSKKSIAAIRLRHWADKTRVQPENLSVWISDDNKVYRRYTESVSFSDETKATLLDRLDFSCRFLKIHSDFEDDKYTFAEDFKRIIEIYGPPDFS